MAGVFLHNESLINYVSCFKERQYLIDGFLYEHSSLMCYAADGVGKSALMLQVALESSSASPVFGHFKVHHPLRSLWIMAERHPDEISERIKSMQEVIKPNFANFAVTTELQGFNLLKENFFDKAIEIVKSRVLEMGGVDVIYVDPIYALVAGGLAKDDTDSVVTRLSTTLQNVFNCSTIFLHHSNRGSRDPVTQKRVNEDMYGGRFLSAHFTGVYHITKIETGTHFKRDKMSHKNLLEAFDLDFDYESYVSTLANNSMPKRDRLMVELRRMQSTGRAATIEEIAAACELSTTYAYNLFSSELNSHIVREHNSVGRKTLYKYVGQ